MAKLKVKTLHDKARMPEYVDGVFLLYPETGFNRAISPNESVAVKTGVSLDVPVGHVALISLSNEAMSPSTGLALAQGLKFIRHGETGEIVLNIFNTSSAVRVIRNEEPIGYFIDVAVSTFDVAKKEAQGVEA
jgi:dUTPase